MISAIKQALRLPYRRKIIFAHVSIKLMIIHISLRLFSFSRVYHSMRRFQRVLAWTFLGPLNDEEICWVINYAGKKWFGDEGCLTQALLGETLLTQAGIQARLIIGVRRMPDGSILAHAWVESDYQILIGGETRAGLKEFQNYLDLSLVIG